MKSIKSALTEVAIFYMQYSQNLAQINYGEYLVNDRVFFLQIWNSI